MPDAPPLSEKADLALFLALSFVPLAALAATVGLKGAAPIGMLTPAIAAMIVQKVQRRAILKPLGIGFGRLRPLVAGWFGLPALIVAGIALSGAMTPGLVQADISEAASHVSLQLGSAQSSLSVGLLVTLVAGPWLNLPLFLGEEIGWRGYLTPRLVARMGRGGVIAAGAIWALWHLPLILLGHNYPQSGLAALPVWIGLCIALSVLMTALRERSGSVLAPAIAHGAMNQVAALMMAAFVVEPKWIDWLHAPTGIAMLALAAGPAAWIFLKRPDWLGASAPMPGARLALA